MSSRLHPFARLCIAAVGLLASQVVAGLAIAAVYVGVLLAQKPGQSVAEIIGQVARVNEANTLLLTLLVYPIGILWLGFCRAKLDKRSFISLGLRRPHLGSNLARGAAAGVLSIAVIWAILWVTGAISVNGLSAAARGPNVVFALMGYLLAFAVVGFFEEFLFRGYTLHNLTNWLGWRAAVLIQATLFALVHLGNVVTASNEARLAALGAMPSIFLIGVFFALSYRKTGSLWFPIGFHAAWNFSLGCLFSLPVSGIKTFQLLDVQTQTQSWISGGSFGAEGSFFLLPVLLALIWFMWQAPDHPQALLDLELVKPEAAPATPATSETWVTSHAAAPREVAPATPATSETRVEADAEPDRENRYRTKFGTSEGFDNDMLRELRELQHQREAAEAEASATAKREQSAVAQAVVDVELLKPVAAEAAAKAAAKEVAAAETSAPIVERAAQVEIPAPIVERAKVETPAPIVERADFVEPTEVKVAVEQPRSEIVAAPVEAEVVVAPAEMEEKQAELPKPVPVKKARPKW